MDTVRVMHDAVGETLTIWFGDAAKEATATMTEENVLVMKDSKGRVIGVEVLGFTGRLTCAVFEDLETKVKA